VQHSIMGVFYIYVSCYSSQLVHVQRIDTLPFALLQMGTAGAAGGIVEHATGAFRA
jgi:hypothetical protein